MRTLLLLSFAAACGSSTPRSATPSQAQVTRDTSPGIATSPKSSVVVWTDYADYSGHGVKAEGRFYRLLDGRWQSAACSVDYNSDPEAGSGPMVPSCGTWTDEPQAHRAMLDSLHQRQPATDIRCDQRPDICRALDLTATNKFTPPP
jgi:hypothetical protein